MTAEIIDFTQDSSEELGSTSFDALMDAERSALISMFRFRKQGNAKDHSTSLTSRQHGMPFTATAPSSRVAQMTDRPFESLVSPNNSVARHNAQTELLDGRRETTMAVSGIGPTTNGYSTTASENKSQKNLKGILSSIGQPEPRFKRTADGHMKVASPTVPLRAVEGPSNGEIQAFRNNILQTHPFLNSQTLPTGETLLGNSKTRSLVMAMINQIKPGQKGRCKEEDDLLVHLKRELGVVWKNMVPYYFPHVDNWHQLQSRYSTKLTPRDPIGRSLKVQDSPLLQSSTISQQIPKDLSDHDERSGRRKSARRERKRREDHSFVNWKSVDLEDIETHNDYDERGIDIEDALLPPAYNYQTTLSARNQIDTNKTLPDSLQSPRNRKPDLKASEACYHQIRPNKRFHMLSSTSWNLKPERVSLRASVQVALHKRELGSGSGSRASCGMVLKSVLSETLGPNLRFREASGDVQTVAWSSDGTQFAAGAAALTDDHSMQYNRPNNLLVGDMTTQRLYELPNHYKYRQLTESGPNSQFEMYAAEGPLLYQSVSAVAYTPDGDTLLSASYDNSVLAWDLSTRCIAEFPHDAPVDLLAVNSRGLFATGAQLIDKSINILQYKAYVDPLKLSTLSSQSALERPGRKILPSCLRWGNTIYDQERYLLAGFSSLVSDNGAFCLWDVSTEQVVCDRTSPEVFDVAWCPSIFGRFAVGMRAQAANVNKGTRSIVKIFDSRLDMATSRTFVSPQRTMELECPAVDMNDVLFNPSDDFILSASCTNGATYLWDLRQPDQVLHCFQHGKSIDAHELDADTGVRMTCWDESHRRLYTGSSDGVVAIWDPYVSEVDARVRDVTHLPSGVMSGSFDPDFSSLLLGEVNGTISVFSLGCDKAQEFLFHPANAEKEKFKIKALQSLPPKITSLLKAESASDTSHKMRQDHDLMVIPFRDHPRGQVVQRHYIADEANSEDDQCKLDHQVSYVTMEEEGDSGASAHRIPEHFRFPEPSRSVPDDNEGHDIPHTLKYPLNAQPQGNAVPAIDLACFRCGNSPIKADFDQKRAYVACEECLSMWFVDCLGYYESNEINKARMRKTRPSDSAFERLGISVLSDKEKRALSSSSPRARRKEYRLDRELLRDLDMLDLGCSDEYYHSFWQD